MTYTDDLTKKIFDRLYDVFSPYSKPERVIGSPISVNEDDDLTLLSKPIKLLTIDDFGHYPSKAMSTWGTKEDFKYFLPRILELSFYSFNLVNGDTLFNKILSSGWKDWNKDEKQILKDYLLAMWMDSTKLPKQNLQKVEILAGSIGYFRDDADQLVYNWAKKWLAYESEESFERLVAYLDANWISIFYEFQPHQALLQAIIESSLLKRLEDAYYKYEKSKPSFSEQILRCEQKLSYYLSNH